MEYNSGSIRASNFKSIADLKLRARGKIRAMHGQTKCPLVLYAKPSNKRFIIPLQKKNYLAIGFYFLVRVFRDILILSVRMTLTISKMFARIICQTIE